MFPIPERWRLFLIFGSFYQEKEQDNFKPIFEQDNNLKK